MTCISSSCVEILFGRLITADKNFVNILLPKESRKQ
jgi:hypothetical protein